MKSKIYGLLWKNIWHTFEWRMQVSNWSFQCGIVTIKRSHSGNNVYLIGKWKKVLEQCTQMHCEICSMFSDWFCLLKGGFKLSYNMLIFSRCMYIRVCFRCNINICLIYVVHILNIVILSNIYKTCLYIIYYT